MTHETKYGEVPYEKVMKSEFELRGLESDKHASYLQYKLLLLDNVVRARVDFARRMMVVYYIKPNKTTQEIMDAIKPVRAIQKTREPMDYDRLVSSSYHG